MIKSVSKEDYEAAVTIFYNSLKNSIKPLRMKDYHNFIHESTNKECHHLLGSYGPLKGSDMLILPVSRSEHDKAHKDTSKFAIENLAESLNWLQKYIIYKQLGEK